MSAVALAFADNLPEPHQRFLYGLPLSFTCGDFFLSMPARALVFGYRNNPRMICFGYATTFSYTKRISVRSSSTATPPIWNPRSSQTGSISIRALTRQGASPAWC